MKSDCSWIDAAHVNVPEIAEHARTDRHIEPSEILKRWRRSLHARSETCEELLVVVGGIKPIVSRSTQQDQRVPNVAGQLTGGVHP